MPISYKDIRNERQWRAATGLNNRQFTSLVKLFATTYENFHGTSLLRQIESCKEEAAFKSYEELLFFILYSLKSDLTYDLLALCFDLSRSVIFEKQVAGVRLLQMTLHQNGDLPRQQYSDFEDLKKCLNGHDELLIDVTEQRRQRPENHKDQKKDYSGKKKHTR